MRNLILAVIIIVLLSTVVWLCFVFIDQNSYERFTIDGEENCERYYENCVCFGSYLVRESYPPQYECMWGEYCREIDRVENC